MKKFTVVGVFRDGGRSVPHETSAETPEQAVENTAFNVNYRQHEDGLYRSDDLPYEEFGWEVSER